MNISIINEVVAQSSKDETTYNTSLRITNIRSSEGTIYIAIFHNNEHFDRQDNFERIPFSKEGMLNGILKVNMNLKPGIIGLSLLDDENNDGEMDKNILGIPREGFGFSNYYHSGFSQPRFDDFKFEVKKGETQNIEMKIRYL